MGILTSNKYISTASVPYEGEFTVTLALSAAPSDIPAGIAIVLGASSDMAGEPLEAVKDSALEFICALEKQLASGGMLGGGTEAAVVSYGSDGNTVQGLTDNVSLLRTAVSSVCAAGNSNLAAGISEAASLLSAVPSDCLKVMFVFTDGRYNMGIDPKIAADNAKNAGITLYFVAVNGSEPADTEAMGKLASCPAAAFVITDFSEDKGTFPYFIGNLNRNLSIGGAENICVAETVGPDFVIAGASAPTEGTVTVTGARTLTWNICSLGETGIEGACLTFNVKNTGARSGEREVNESAEYTDSSCNTAEFNSPTILVDCGQIDYYEPCPEPVESVSPACEEIISIDAGEISMGLMGRIAQVSVTLRNICPGRRVAVAAVLTELDSEGNEYQRGMRTLTIPAHHYSSCRDIRVGCITFVIPEDVDDMTAEACGERMFRARVYANVIDSGVGCCGTETGIIPI